MGKNHYHTKSLQVLICQQLRATSVAKRVTCREGQFVESYSKQLNKSVDAKQPNNESPHVAQPNNE